MPNKSQERIKVRRIEFDYPEGGLNRLYVDNDLILSHLVAVLSGLFPEGEDFFIKSVKHFSDQIVDPELKQAVKGFIGQEVTHGREHRALNKRLQQMGYPTQHVDRFTHWLLFELNDKWFVPSSPKMNLAATAALEHYTASLAEMVLSSSEVQRLLGDTEVRSTLLWHALEESEHKAVAFDVFRAIGGTEKRRIRTMYMVNVLFLGIVTGAVMLSLARDKAAYNPVRLARSVRNLWKSPLISRELLRTIRAYNHKGFHPDDFDATELLDTWREELFGEQGDLVNRLK